ncbi:jacalin-like lectin [Deinococcus sp.]|uniref:jacalin-like lectin n=1 Tax=Deinococcus sp. TaxID=47478 RepID=UPI003CC5FCE8
MITYRFGPSGGHGGRAFEEESPLRLAALRIRHAGRIDAVELLWDDGSHDAAAHPAQLHGGSGGTAALFELRGADEWLTRLSGRYGQTVDSLRLETNLGRFAEFGGSGGDHAFCYDVPAGYALVGLFGSAGHFLDALGVILGPRAASPDAAPSEAASAAPPKAAGRKTPAKKTVPKAVAAASAADGRPKKARKSSDKTVDVPASPPEEAPKPKRSRKKLAE